MVTRFRVVQFRLWSCLWLTNRTLALRSSDFVNHLYDYRLNRTPLGPITIINLRWKHFNQEKNLVWKHYLENSILGINLRLDSGHLLRPFNLLIREKSKSNFVKTNKMAFCSTLLIDGLFYSSLFLPLNFL